MDAGCCGGHIDAGVSSPKAAARAAGMESLKHLKNLTYTVRACTEEMGRELGNDR